MVQFLIPVAAICAAYLLYQQGLGVTKSIAAVLFVFRPGDTRDIVSVNLCSGWARHIGRFQESRTYGFVLDCRLSTGDVEVLLLDRDKRELLRLNPASPSGSVKLDGKGRYYLHWEFRRATGKCELRW